MSLHSSPARKRAPPPLTRALAASLLVVLALAAHFSSNLPYTPHLTLTEATPKLPTERATEATQASHGERPPCLSLVLYDKPPKTGSTAVSAAIEAYLEQAASTSGGPPGGASKRCWVPHCLNQMLATCNGTRPAGHIFGHTEGTENREERPRLYECLRARGYYTVTSIRKPLERWDSVYFYYVVQARRPGLYGLNSSSSYEQFMKSIPECALYNYYDGMGLECDAAGMGWRERLKRIVKRYDEVLEVGEPAAQDFERRLGRYMKIVNEAARDDGYRSNGVDYSRLYKERMLYEGLQQVRKRGPKGNRHLCGTISA